MPVNTGEIEILIPVDLFQCVLDACDLFGNCSIPYNQLTPPVDD